MEMADVMANDSYKDLGYEYVNIDVSVVIPSATSQLS